MPDTPDPHAELTSRETLEHVVRHGTFPDGARVGARERASLLTTLSKLREDEDAASADSKLMDGFEVHAIQHPPPRNRLLAVDVLGRDKDGEPRYRLWSVHESEPVPGFERATGPQLVAGVLLFVQAFAEPATDIEPDAVEQEQPVRRSQAEHAVLSLT